MWVVGGAGALAWGARVRWVDLIELAGVGEQGKGGEESRGQALGRNPTSVSTILPVTCAHLSGRKYLTFLLSLAGQRERRTIIKLLHARCRVHSTVPFLVPCFTCTFPAHAIDDAITCAR